MFVADYPFPRFSRLLPRRTPTTVQPFATDLSPRAGYAFPMEADLVVVGAGPAGSIAALAAARGGPRGALTDQKGSVGEAGHRGGGVSRFALAAQGLPPRP